MAQKETFQGQVRPPFNYASGMFNNFFGRMVLNPFYKTPSNVFSEIGDRFYFGPGSELVKAVKKGQGREFDEAMAKLVTGWGVILFGANLVAGHYGDDVIITGHVLTDVTQTAAVIEQNSKVKNKDHRVFLDGIYKYEKTKGIENNSKKE